MFPALHALVPLSPRVLAKRTQEYNRWVEAFALNHAITMEWVEKGVRKEG